MTLGNRVDGSARNLRSAPLNLAKRYLEIPIKNKHLFQTPPSVRVTYSAVRKEMG